MPELIASTAKPRAPEGIWALSPQDSTAAVDRLGDEIAELSAHIQAATYRLLTLIREFDDRAGWNTGFRSCAHWLNWRTGLDIGAAREKVRVAHALADLPEISEAMRRGRLSYSKVRALTRVATTETEAELLEFALTGTAAHVERLVRAWRRVDRLEAMGEGRRQREQRYLRTWHDEDGILVVQARLTPEMGAVFLKAIEAAGEVLFKEGQSGGSGDSREQADLPHEQRRADALELVAESALEGGLDPGTAGDRYQVVVHVQGDADVSAETSRRETESRALRSGELETGTRVSAETSQRLLCDSGRVVMRNDSDGKVLDVGRKTRTVHPALRRALRHRDGGCRFPGCGLQICDAHHVRPWAEGGDTSLENLLLLCRHHHRALHEGGFRVELGSDGSCHFFTPRGAPIPEAPVSQVPDDDPVDALRRNHREDGLRIDPMTGLPRWDGEGLDLASAIDSLRQALVDDDGGPEPDVSAETSPGDGQGCPLLFAND